MQIGKPGKATTGISTADAAQVLVRGRDLATDLIGRTGFTEYFCLLLTGREPNADQKFFLDAVLVAIAEHGLVPSVQAARMTLAAAPESLQGAVAAGLLGAGSVILGASESCALLLAQGVARQAKGENGVALALAEEIHARGERMPGFGHPLHKPADPRAERLLLLAEERRIAGPAIRLAVELRPAVARIWRKELPMNVSMPIAAILLDLDFPPSIVKAVPILARTAGLLAHLAEEQANPIGFRMASAGEEAISYVPEKK